MMLEITKPIVLVREPTIFLMAQPALVHAGVLDLARWVESHRPECVPAEGFTGVFDLLPHDSFDRAWADGAEAAGTWQGVKRGLSDAEVLVELAGRKCYDSFAEKAGKKSNQGYLANIQAAGHSSVLYHSHFTFGFVGVSRKFSHQFIRNYVGSAREEEGAPSQESTRYTHHYGHYVIPPYILEIEDEARREALIETFRQECQANAESYRTFIKRELESEMGSGPQAEVSVKRKKEIMEAGAGMLSMSAETSFIWTSNPIALTKFMVERGSPHADAEMQRFTRRLAPVCFKAAQNLFQDSRLDFLR